MSNFRRGPKDDKMRQRTNTSELNEEKAARRKRGDKAEVKEVHKRQEEGGEEETERRNGGLQTSERQVGAALFHREGLSEVSWAGEDQPDVARVVFLEGGENGLHSR